MLSPCFTIDGLDPAVQVKVVRGLIHEVTGIRINTFFLAWDQDLDGNGSPGNGQGSSSGGELWVQLAASSAVFQDVPAAFSCAALPGPLHAVHAAAAASYIARHASLSQLQAILYCLTGFIPCNIHVA